MSNIYEALDGLIGNGDTVGFDAVGEGASIELRRTESGEASGPAVKGIRLLVDGSDVIFVDEDGTAGVYRHANSWIALHVG